jgi:hypothetical protein
LGRGGGDVVDVFRARHGLGDRRRDEALDQVGARARVGGRDGDDRFFDLRILADLHVHEALQTEQQDEHADDDREDREPDEDFGEVHCAGSAARA